jgi:hypothetical protein
MTRPDLAWRGLAAFVLAVSAGTLWLGGAGSLQAAQTVTAMSRGQAASSPFVCDFKRRTGHPCPGCGGTTAFEHAAHGEWRAATATNPLGAFAGLAAWALAAASLLTVTGAGAGWLRGTGAAVLVLLPAAFLADIVVWFLSLPPGALH